MIKPELVRENPPEIARSHKTEPIDWNHVLKKAARSNAWYKIAHAFPTPTAASSVASELRKNKKGDVKNVKFDAVARGTSVYVKNLTKKAA